MQTLTNSTVAHTPCCLFQFFSWDEKKNWSKWTGGYLFIVGSARGFYLHTVVNVSPEVK